MMFIEENPTGVVIKPSIKGHSDKNISKVNTAGNFWSQMINDQGLIEKKKNDLIKKSIQF